MITAFLNQKGGVGKTTLSYSYATALAREWHKVLLVDADPQHGAKPWQIPRSTQGSADACRRDRASCGDNEPQRPSNPR